MTSLERAAARARKNSINQLPATKATIDTSAQGCTRKVDQRKHASTAAMNSEPMPTSNREPFVSSTKSQCASCTAMYENKKVALAIRARAVRSNTLIASRIAPTPSNKPSVPLRHTKYANIRGRLPTFTIAREISMAVKTHALMPEAVASSAATDTMT
jgi:hypothetical protein